MISLRDADTGQVNAILKALISITYYKYFLHTD